MKGDPPTAMFDIVPGKMCEMENCGKQAYFKCGDKQYYTLGCLCCLGPVKQCGRTVCENHIEIHYGKQKHSDYYVQWACCKE